MKRSNENINKMSREERLKEIVDNLEGAIERGGEPNAIAKLKVILENIKNGTHTVQKRRGRKPSKRGEEKPNTNE